MPHFDASRHAERFGRVGLLALVLMLAITGMPPVQAQKPSQKQAASEVLDLPATLAGFQKGIFTDFEPEHPGLGYRINYRRDGWSGDIYVYDLRLQGIPSDPRSNVMVSQFEQAKGDVLAMQANGSYANVSFGREFDVAGAPRQPKFRCVAISLDRKDGGALDSYLCLGGNRGKFVKVRLSTPKRDGNEAMARQFVEQLAQALAG